MKYDLVVIIKLLLFFIFIMLMVHGLLFAYLRLY